MRFLRIIVTKGDDSKLKKQNISTTVSEDLIVTHLIGKIKTADVNEWFNGFEQVCQQFISEGRKYNCWWIEKDTRQIIFLFKKHGKISSLMKPF